MRASVYIATSLDGFIARSDGDLDWLDEAGEEVEPESEEDYGYQAFMDTVDVLVMGRHTFEKVLTLGPWPFESKRVVVLTSRPLMVPDDLRPVIEVMSGTPEEIAAHLQESGAEHIYVDGGRTIQRFLEAGLIQRLIITRVPVLIGSGIPLIGQLSKDVRLRHLATRSYANGFVQSEYEIEPVAYS